MTKQKKIDALKKLRKEIRENSRNGLCIARHYLFIEKKIDIEQSIYLDSIIPKSTSKKCRPYHWTKGVKAPRIAWCNRRLKQLEKKNA